MGGGGGKQPPNNYRKYVYIHTNLLSQAEKNQEEMRNSIMTGIPVQTLQSADKS